MELPGPCPQAETDLYVEIFGGNNNSQEYPPPPPRTACLAESTWSLPASPYEWAVGRSYNDVMIKFSCIDRSSPFSIGSSRGSAISLFFYFSLFSFFPFE